MYILWCNAQSVRDNVQAWKVTMYEQQEDWVKAARQKKENVIKAQNAKDEKKKLLDLKKLFSKKVKDEVAELSKTGDDLRSQHLQANKDQAAKVRSETSDEVTDQAKKIFFEQRRAAAKQIKEQVEGWEKDRSTFRASFSASHQAMREKSKAMESAARGARKTLAAEKAKNAAEIRAQKQQAAQTHRTSQEDRLAETKLMVNSTIGNKFVQTEMARRMLQHPHYAEVSAVVTDVTSQISKEIAASPRRRPPSGATAGGGKASAAALRMSPNASSRNVSA
jgi:hypothetical protein